MKKLLVVLLSIVLLTACGDKKLDFSSPDSLKQSVDQIASDLNGEEKQQFMDAVNKIVTQVTNEAKGDTDKVNELIKEKLNGKTVTQVIKEATKEKVDNLLK